MAKTLREEIREKYPRRAKAAARGGKVGVQLFCLECFGGSNSAAMNCPDTDCFLWALIPYRVKKAKED